MSFSKNLAPFPYNFKIIYIRCLRMVPGSCFFYIYFKIRPISQNIYKRKLPIKIDFSKKYKFQIKTISKIKFLYIIKLHYYKRWRVLIEKRQKRLVCKFDFENSRLKISKLNNNDNCLPFLMIFTILVQPYNAIEGV